MNFVSRSACSFHVFALFLILFTISPPCGWSMSGTGNFQQFLYSSELEDKERSPQLGDTIYLDDILIESTRIYEPLRYQPIDVQVMDSLQMALNRTMPLSAVLSRYSSLYIRDNGPGGYASISQRGLSPGQTQLLWEGFPLNSLSLGMADLSLFSASMFQSVEVSPGTPSSTFGGGSLGGAVYLSSSRPEQKRLEIMQSAGAFGTYNSQLHASYAEDRWSASLQSIYQTAENDFSYINRATGLKENRVNNAGRGGQIIGNVGYQLDRGRIYSSAWFSDRIEDIPGSVLSGDSGTAQSDRSFRWLAGLETSTYGWNINLRSFLERDRFFYEDLSANTDSRFRKGRWLTNLEFKRPALGPVIWKGGISGGVEMVNTSNYSDERQRSLLGIHMNPNVHMAEGRLRVTPTIRVDAYTDFGWVVSPSLGTNWEVFKERLHLRGMVSRDFNPPSFNDLYWIPSGNTGLEPERSFKAEGGFTYLSPLPFIDSIKLTGYNIWLNEGIYWFPNSEGVWAPSNVGKVDAYGAESRLNLHWETGPADFFWELGADWRKAEIAEERFPGDQAVGQQMRYVPEWTFRSNLSVQISPVHISANYRWTDQRYITEDHTSSLGPFQVFDVSVNVDQELLKADWGFQLAVNNLLGERYEIVQWYPMPGRYLEFSLSLGLPI
ncbi:MAG: TonB-dependent receptor plug domain-containing protein [Balneolales bacterium]